MCILQVFSLNLITVFMSVAVLLNMEFLDSSSDSIQFTGFNLSDVEELEVE